MRLLLPFFQRSAHLKNSGLSEPFGDGPYMFSSMLSNNFRTEAINVTDILVNHDGLFQSYFIQGSQRWQSLKLVKGDGVRFKRIGFVPTSTTTEKQNESGVSPD